MELYECDLSFLGGLGHVHKFVIVETTNWYYTVEKNDKGLSMQRSKKKSDVRENVDGHKRDKGEPSLKKVNKVSYGDSLQKLIQWIVRYEIHVKYDLIGDNCKDFAVRCYSVIMHSGDTSL